MVHPGGGFLAAGASKSPFGMSEAPRASGGPCRPAISRSKSGRAMQVVRNMRFLSESRFGRAPLLGRRRSLADILPAHFAAGNRGSRRTDAAKQHNHSFETSAGEPG